MPMTLEGSCRCGAVSFTLSSHSPEPYQRCYCSICRKTAGGGGYAINLMGNKKGMKIRGKPSLGVYRAKLGEGKQCHVSSGERNFCTKCGSALWLYDPTWPELVHPFASAIDTALPAPPATTHLMLNYKAPWVVVQKKRGDLMFDEYPKESIEQWHKRHHKWIA